jgi:hypothetical protein
LKAAQLVQWTPEAALALINGAIRSNFDNSPALAAILTRLADYARRARGGRASSVAFPKAGYGWQGQRSAAASLSAGHR